MRLPEVRRKGSNSRSIRESRNKKQRKFSFIRFVNVLAQHSDERQISVAFREIQPITDHEEIRNFETNVIRTHGLCAARFFVQENARFEAIRLESAQLF